MIDANVLLGTALLTSLAAGVCGLCFWYLYQPKQDPAIAYREDYGGWTSDRLAGCQLGAAMFFIAALVLSVIAVLMVITLVTTS